MTTSQYLSAWAMYGAAVIGCLIVWWRLTRPLNATFASWLRLIVAVLLFTPGYADPDKNWLSPAMLSIVYEVLNDGPQGLTLNGLILMVSTTLALVIKTLFFRKPLRIGAFLFGSENTKDHQSRQPSQEQLSGGDKKIIRYREHQPSPYQTYENNRVEPRIS